jgi:replicative DNA helicase
MVLIDYLQLMTGAGKRAGESRQQEISDISRSLKAVARELDVPIVALSQLSRAVEQRPNKRPMLSDLRESGAIEQDADLVMFIYRDEYYNPDTDDKNQAEIIIAKHRNGPVGTVKLGWTPALTRFTNLETRPDYQK